MKSFTSQAHVSKDLRDALEDPVMREKLMVYFLSPDSQNKKAIFTSNDKKIAVSSSTDSVTISNQPHAAVG